MISHDRGRIEPINVTRHRTAAGVWLQVIEATTRGRRPRFVLRDGDCSYDGDFIDRARRIAILTVVACHYSIPSAEC